MPLAVRDETAARRVRVELHNIPPGEAGTDATVAKLGELVRGSLRAQRVRLVALQILQNYNVPNQDQAAAARAIYAWVKNHVRYVPDPTDLETVQSPDVTLQLRAGDCDDHAALVVALANSIGIRGRYRVMGPDRRRFRHIYPELLVGQRWRPADTTRQSGSFDMTSPSLGASKTYTSEGKPSMYLGLGEDVGTGLKTVPVEKKVLEGWAYRGAITAMRHNWNAGLINRADVQGYLQTIDAGNAPGRGTFAEAPMRQAVVDFLAETKGRASGKPPGTTGLEGLDGFLSSVWKGVKAVVGAGVKLVTGGSTQVTVTPPQIVVPKIETTVTPESARAGVGAFLRDPVVLIAGGALLLMLFMRRR